MTDRRNRTAKTRDTTGYQNKMMGDYEKRGFTTTHLRRPAAKPMSKPTDKPAEPAATPSSSSNKPSPSSS